MKTKDTIFATLFSVLLCTIPANAEHLTLVEKRGPKASIVLGRDAGEVEKFAAAELQNYVKKLTNATLPITNKMPPSDSPSIVIGQNKHTNKLDLSTKKLGTYQLTASPVDGHKIQIPPAKANRVKLAFHDFTNPSHLGIIEVEVFRASK